ncbi:polyphosphate kinase 1 [Niabella drilacis]|uniref:Polyphosphate kinase n=1 Tax=Niabella drilacis (strain DSM 25811 / CCM 8410 / CCUG 62505 / LMG 26954 / E90) TaxID=1285928 RepID=A0A1G6XAK1_NIADE|nr:polyphosphate kinase 1 [Niabella drilacis]SDD75204.1 polyphosphate kinase [Niabella drilacis]
MEILQKWNDRDISWLQFNGRVLEEAARQEVPLLERVNFLAIYSSNLDEFYRVRMPVIKAIGKLEAGTTLQVTDVVKELINRQQQRFGYILREQIIPALRQEQIYLVYNEPIPEGIHAIVKAYFFDVLAAYIVLIPLNAEKPAFLENNKLYMLVALEQESGRGSCIVSIPSDKVPRFLHTVYEGITYVLFIDDIIRMHLGVIFKDAVINGAYNIKITRDAELSLQDEYAGDIAVKIEAEIQKRDFGLATRLLYPPDLPAELLHSLIETYGLQGANTTSGGYYHNLKDFFSFPVKPRFLLYPPEPAFSLVSEAPSLFEHIAVKDFIVHTPYCSYDAVLRFFNEAAINPDVAEVYTTMYRVARDSRIANALITAAKNGKKVTAFVELKARFDEENNIRWAKTMKAAGVKIIYSIPGLKVHAKVALVRIRKEGRLKDFGLFSTGNFNESSARIYTDHILFTARPELLRELELLFIFLAKRRKPLPEEQALFTTLLVAQFNLQQEFLKRIDAEIGHARAGRKAGITIKLNNLEEEVMISKLYEASCAGVTINLIVRGICRLVPGVENLSSRIKVKRIVDRYLEHGRIFLFENNGDPQVYLGSADWMNRNLYRRIEVCFPVNDPELEKELITILQMQWEDTAAAVRVGDEARDVPLWGNKSAFRSQRGIYLYLKEKYER